MIISYLASRQPTHAILLKRLNPRLELRLLQLEIVNRADSRDRHAWVSARSPVHQRSADGAEAVLHRVARRGRLVLLEARELVLAAQVFEVRVSDDEVGGEHGGGDFAAVGAVAEECVHETFAGGGLDARR